MLSTEFAPCGSLMGYTAKKSEPSEKIKVKRTLDTTRGFEYLHENGIMHRDIKLDDVLVLSLDMVVNVNGNLTDFGSLR